LVEQADSLAQNLDPIRYCMMWFKKQKQTKTKTKHEQESKKELTYKHDPIVSSYSQKS